MRSAWRRCSPTLRASVGGNPGAPPLLAGTGADRVHLLLVCTGERGLCGPFNSAIVRLARERANALLADGKEVKFFCVGRKGFEQLKRQFEGRIIETVELRAVRQIRFETCRRDRAQDRGAVQCRPVRRLHAVLLALQVGDRADPDRPAAHSGGVRRRPRTSATAPSTNTSPTRRKSSPSCCRATSRCRFSAP